MGPRNRTRLIWHFQRLLSYLRAGAAINEDVVAMIHQGMSVSPLSASSCKRAMPNAASVRRRVKMPVLDKTHWLTRVISSEADAKQQVVIDKNRGKQES